jgi:hypothetical protein
VDRRPHASVTVRFCGYLRIWVCGNAILVSGWVVKLDGGFEESWREDGDGVYDCELCLFDWTAFGKFVRERAHMLLAQG